jgi:adenosine deaminase
MEDHNLKRLLDRGLCVTVNSDDPAYFGGYVAENYLEVSRALGLSRADVTQLAANSIEASLLPDAKKQEWQAKIRAFAARAVS